MHKDVCGCTLCMREDIYLQAPVGDRTDLNMEKKVTIGEEIYRCTLLTRA
jgi:hypothetical protein